MTSPDPAPPTFEDVVEADRAVRLLALETPLLRADALDAATGGRVFVKAECLQPRGAFKIRGAMNALSRIPVEDRGRGVVAWSSGNHAQAVALTAKALGMRATIIVPADAPRNKLDPARADGAEIVFYDRVTESREAIGAAIAARTGAVVVPPFDDPRVIAGQGTVGLEIVRQGAAMGVAFDALGVCVSGGGLAAGIALTLEALSPRTRLVTVEPVGHEDMALSLAGDAAVTNAPGVRSIQDALMAPRPGELTLPILRRAGASGVAVSDEEALDAMAFAAKHLRLVLEPGGAAALAAVLTGKIDARGRVIAVVASGGNVDAEVLARALSRAG
jgi:threonine dehydratase